MMWTQISMRVMKYSFLAAYHKSTLDGVFSKHSSAGRNKLNLLLISILLLAALLQKGGCWSYLHFFPTSFLSVEEAGFMKFLPSFALTTALSSAALFRHVLAQS